MFLNKLKKAVICTMIAVLVVQPVSAWADDKTAEHYGSGKQEEQADPGTMTDEELLDLYDRDDGLVVFADTLHLLKERENGASVSLNEVGVYPSPVGSVNYISGIKTNAEVRWTGMDAWWKKKNGLITFDENWSRFYTKKISDLKRGDVIEWKDDDKYGGLYTNHIAIVTEVADDSSYFVTADGNCGGKTGVNFIKHKNLKKGGSTGGKVNIWRNAENGDIIADSVSIFTKKIVKTEDTSLIDYFWGTLGINWCYCFVVEALLQVNIDGTYYKQPELYDCKYEAGGIRFSWKAVPGAESYSVYYKQKKEDTYTRLADTTETSYLFDRAVKGQVYAFTAVARGEFGKSKKDQNGKLGVLLDGTKVNAEKRNKAVKLTWKAVPASAGYVVYRKTSGGQWEVVAATKNTSYKDTGYKAGAFNNYLVKPYVTYGSEKCYGSVDETTQAAGITIPKAPAMKSVASGNRSLLVTWKPVSGAKGYNVYRRTKGQKWQKIATTKKTTYKDKKVKAGIKYVYTVSAYTAENIESDYNLTSLGSYYVPFAKIKKIVKVRGGLKLKWKKAESVSEYIIYRRVPGGKWKKIKTVNKKTNSYIDYKGKKKTTYEYLVRAVKIKRGETYFSWDGEKLIKKRKFPKK